MSNFRPVSWQDTRMRAEGELTDRVGHQPKDGEQRDRQEGCQPGHPGSTGPPERGEEKDGEDDAGHLGLMNQKKSQPPSFGERYK